MKTRTMILSILVFALTAAADNIDADLVAIGKVLDDFHDAAAHGDKERYLGHLGENGVFMGTDEWERWPKNPEFSDYVDGRFNNGSGWNYRSVERQVRIADSADVAWFDEVVFSEANGRFRGTGMLSRQGDDWKIEHYAMSFLILNENWEEVIDLTRKTKKMTEDSRSPD